MIVSSCGLTELWAAGESDGRLQEHGDGELAAVDRGWKLMPIIMKFMVEARFWDQNTFLEQSPCQPPFIKIVLLVLPPTCLPICITAPKAAKAAQARHAEKALSLTQITGVTQALNSWNTLQREVSLAPSAYIAKTAHQ